jgi:hypothetical protein
MDSVEYLFTILSIVLGLGLTDLAKSFRELVRPGRTVRWHWLPAAWATFTLLLVISLWWNIIGFLGEAPPDFFVLSLVLFLVLYLICAFALPDPDWKANQKTNLTTPEDAASDASTSKALDLEAFYYSKAHRRWYFGLLIALLFLAEAGMQAIAVAKGPGLNPQSAALSGGAIALLAPLILTRTWWVHAPVTIAFLVEITWTIVNIVI